MGGLTRPSPPPPAQDVADKRGGSSKKSSKKTVELDEKLWSQTQLSVSSWQHHSALYTQRRVNFILGKPGSSVLTTGAGH